MKLKKKISLPTKIFIGLVIGIAIGLIFGQKATLIEPIGTIFLRLITLVVVPLVFVSLLLGTAGVGDIKKVGRMGLKTLAYFIFTTILAISIGLLLANIARPGSGLSSEVQARIQQTTEAQSPIDLQKLQKPSTIQILIDIIPTNPVKAFTEGNMLQIIFMALLFGTVFTMIPRDKAQPILFFLDGLNEAIIQIVHLAMKLAPYGVLALIASVTGKFGLSVLITLFKYAATVIGGLFLYGVTWNSLAVASLGRMNPLSFFRGVREALLIAFSTSSSNATLPVAIDCLDRIGISRQYSSFVMPLGATINMDGTALYQGVSAVFISQIYGISLGLGGQLMIVLMATLASIGAAGVPSAGIITLVMVLKQIGVPLEGLALILGVERFLDMCRTTVNVIGNLACSVVIQQWEKGK
jgi:Na+/H+-dicarboxylate symporter